MIRVVLHCESANGSREIELVSPRTRVGRSSDADEIIDDHGLSRINSTIYVEDERVWIVDDGSTNGTFVNGQPTPAAGTPLSDGDVIKMGTSTRITVRFTANIAEVAPVNVLPVSTQPPIQPKGSFVPIAVIAGGIFAIVMSVGFILFAGFGGSSAVVIDSNYQDPDDITLNDPRPSPSRVPSPSNSSSDIANTNVDTTDPLPNSNSISAEPLPSGKKYQEMSDVEKRRYLETKAMRVAQVIGNNSSEAIPAAAVDRIKSFTDAYASRVKVKPLGGCRFGDNLQVTFERASKNAPFVVRAFNEKGIDPRIGLYLAMIESEHCVCLQSPTGPLGMFQFTKSTGEIHGLKVFPGASPTNPDERCEPEPAARAAASYMKALTGRYGTGPASVPLAIGSYNSGEGGLSSNLQKALDANSGLPRDFWSLIANSEKLSKQFQSENFKYVPKFFAAAIIGENPRDFGLDLNPVSTYSK